MFDKNLKWKICIHNLKGKLQAVAYEFIKLKNWIPTHMMRIIYFVLYQSTNIVY